MAGDPTVVLSRKMLVDRAPPLRLIYILSRTMAQSFSNTLDNVFGIDNSLDGLARIVEQKYVHMCSIYLRSDTI